MTINDFSDLMEEALTSQGLDRGTIYNLKLEDAAVFIVGRSKKETLKLCIAKDDLQDPNQFLVQLELGKSSKEAARQLRILANFLEREALDLV
jgi:hypothetical protein